MRRGREVSEGLDDGGSDMGKVGREIGFEGSLKVDVC